MNQRIWSGLTVTLITAVFGTAKPSYAQQTRTVDQRDEGSRPTVQVQQLPSTTTLVSEHLPTQSVDVVKVGELQSRSRTTAQGDAIAKIYAYESAGQQAVTLYVRNIPLLTFLGSSSVAANGTKVGEVAQATAQEKRASHNLVSANAGATTQLAAQEENNPVWRATAVAAKLNQLNQNNIDARAIAVSWNPTCNCYSIKANNQELVQINKNTILADTTRNLAQDALQATNRLRRLIGNAPPLRQIANMPQRRQRTVTQVAFGPIRLQFRGMASWYGPGFHGNRSASGEIYNQNAMTAAHRSLPFGTAVQVTNLNNGRSVVVRINDRGPYAGGRIIDLSAAAARVLGLFQSGVAPVQLEVLDNPRRLAAEN